MNEYEVTIRFWGTHTVTVNAPSEDEAQNRAYLSFNINDVDDCDCDVDDVQLINGSDDEGDDDRPDPNAELQIPLF